MRWFVPARRHVLKSLQRPLHGGSALCSHYRCINALTSMGCSKPMKLPSYSYHEVHFSTFLSGHSECSNSLNGHQNENKKVDLKIVSRETIKPASPTPHHLRTYNLSLLDQWMFDVYSPLALFIPNTDKASLYDVVTKRSKHLKESLSHILTHFYPIAGEVKENLYIECNDKGVYYIEARVNQTLEDFLCQADDEKVRELNPGTPRTAESSIGNYVIGIQVNIFNCGGIGLSTSLSHKIIDGHTYFLFMQAWATAARGSPNITSPSFVASQVFPNNPCLKHYSAPSKLVTTEKLITKRFVFGSTALALLKAQPVASGLCGPTRMEATTALIWKAAANAASHVRTFSPQSPHALLSAVNLRRRASQLLPNESMGNLVASACAVCYPESQPDLSTLMYEIRKSIAKINSDHIESLKCENGHETMDVMLRELNHLTDVTQEGDVLFVTSLLKSGMYEWDFGWGKPIWFYDMNAGFTRFMSLNDTLTGGGVEATVTLSPDEMEIFESDHELLSYVKVEPSPLQYVKDA